MKQNLIRGAIQMKTRTIQEWQQATVEVTLLILIADCTMNEYTNEVRTSIKRSLAINIDANHDECSDEELSPMDTQIMNLINSCPNRSIRPAKLVTELGISMESATEELCGLMKAVGPTATFKFEKMDHATVMVFEFPPDFVQLAFSSRRKEDVKVVLWNILLLMIKILKVIIAFGLILSLFVLSIAMFAAMIAMWRHNGGRNNQRLMNHMRSMLLTIRQFLWCYVVWGQGLDNGQDPFIRETAHNLALISNLILSSPGNIWWWISVGRLRERQQRSRGIWRRMIQEKEEVEQHKDTEGNDQRGILSVAVEFLFGPTPFSPGPSHFDTWKFREFAILSLLSDNSNDSVSLEQLLPFIDYPTSNKASHNNLVSCLDIVTHFGGVPISESKSESLHLKMRFSFPELISESKHGYQDSNFCTLAPTDGQFHMKTFFFQPTVEYSSPSSIRQSSGLYLVENMYLLTKLDRKQFSQCLILNTINYIGTIILSKSIDKDGALEIQDAAAYTVLSWFLSVLAFYAILFFIIPTLRGVLITYLNCKRMQRNNQRRDFYNEYRLKK
jgi:hypothetical protein